jgi:hypothetical protein
MERPDMKNLTADHIRLLNDWHPFQNFHILIPQAHIYVVLGTMFIELTYTYNLATCFGSSWANFQTDTNIIKNNILCVTPLPISFG